MLNPFMIFVWLYLESKIEILTFFQNGRHIKIEIWANFWNCIKIKVYMVCFNLIMGELIHVCSLIYHSIEIVYINNIFQNGCHLTPFWNLTPFWKNCILKFCFIYISVHVILRYMVYSLYCNQSYSCLLMYFKRILKHYIKSIKIHY